MKYKGIILSQGAANGKILNQKQGSLGLEIKSCILVCSIFTPRMYYHLPFCRGIIVEKGGMLCHAAIVARESNIPCIQVDNATIIFNTGQSVEIQDNGDVELIDARP